MTLPQILVDLMKLLFDMAVPVEQRRDQRYRFRFERCRRTANSSTRRVLHFKGGARCSGGTQPTRVDHRWDLLAVGVWHGAVDAELEQRLNSCDDRHAYFGVEFSGRNDFAGAAGLAVAGAIFNYARHRPFMPLIASGLAFLSVSGIWKLVQAMVG